MGSVSELVEKGHALLDGDDENEADASLAVVRTELPALVAALVHDSVSGKGNASRSRASGGSGKRSSGARGGGRKKS